MPLPGGCVIGKRPVDDHINGLKRIGYSATMKEESIELDGTVQPGDRTINAGFSVSGTENLLVANVLRKGTTTIELAAIEPHVMNLIDFLRAA
jgi:UDP-N-acetylglucosamine 1-carboxyvinyltransferase